MQITIKFSSLFKVHAGVDQDLLEVAGGTTVDQLCLVLGQKYQNLLFNGEQTFYVVNDKIAPRDRILADGDVVHIYQALAGG